MWNGFFPITDFTIIHYTHIMRFCKVVLGISLESFEVGMVWETKVFGRGFIEMECFLFSFASNSFYFPLLQVFLLSFAAAKER